MSDSGPQGPQCDPPALVELAYQCFFFSTTSVSYTLHYSKGSCVEVEPNTELWTGTAVFLELGRAVTKPQKRSTVHAPRVGHHLPVPNKALESQMPQLCG